jgi:predicted transcriptional regulator
MSSLSGDKAELLALTSEIVSSHVSNNPVPTADLPALINSVYETLEALTVEAVEEVEELKPAVSVKKSVSDDAIVCLDCGKSMKMLKRHLSTEHGLTPEDYRARWNLSADYPMVAPNYAATRQALAKKIGLGRNRGGKKAAKK